MSIFAIADLHLSFSSEKPMDLFGGQWVNHVHSIEKNWKEQVTDDDYVIIPGDISWALKLDEALADLQWIHQLPGKKVLIKGNHDLWWASITRLNKLFDNMFFLQNTAFPMGEYALCGTRGWTCPLSNGFTVHDEKIYKRELLRLQFSLDDARKKGYQKLIAALHFPPTDEGLRRSGFTDLFEQYGVEKVIYGHLHGKDAYKNGLKGHRNGVEYILTSCDYIKCKPVKIIGGKDESINYSREKGDINYPG